MSVVGDARKYVIASNFDQRDARKYVTASNFDQLIMELIQLTNHFINWKLDFKKSKLTNLISRFKQISFMVSL